MKFSRFIYNGTGTDIIVIDKAIVNAIKNSGNIEDLKPEIERIVKESGFDIDYEVRKRNKYTDVLELTLYKCRRCKKYEKIEYCIYNELYENVYADVLGRMINAVEKWGNEYFLFVKKGKWYWKRGVFIEIIDALKDVQNVEWRVFENECGIDSIPKHIMGIVNDYDKLVKIDSVKAIEVMKRVKDVIERIDNRYAGFGVGDWIVEWNNEGNVNKWGLDMYWNLENYENFLWEIVEVAYWNGYKLKSELLMLPVLGKFPEF